MRAINSGLVEWHHATLCAARPNDLLAALKVMLLSTTALFERLANGVYFCPLLTQSQWISSDSSTTRCFRQISPMRSRSSGDQQLPVGFCGLQRMKLCVSMLMRRSKSSKSIWNLPLTNLSGLSSAFVSDAV